MTTEEKLATKLTSALKSIPGGYHNPDIVGECVKLMKELAREVVEEMLGAQAVKTGSMDLRIDMDKAMDAAILTSGELREDGTLDDHAEGLRSMRDNDCFHEDHEDTGS